MDDQETLNISEVAEYGKKEYGLVDLMIMGPIILLTIVIILIMFFQNRKISMAEDYFLGGRNIHPLLAAQGIINSYLSPVFLLNTPAEIYYRGAEISWIIIPAIVVTILTIQIYAPVYFSTKTTSIYEYMGKRFGSTLRMLCSIAEILKLLLYLSVVLYLIAAVKLTNISAIGTILLSGSFATLSVLVGGLKVSLWRDICLTGTTYIFYILIVIFGIKKIGLGQIWKRNLMGLRIKPISFTLDPTITYTFWSVVIGGFIMWNGFFLTSQSLVQNYICVKSLLHAKISLLLAIIGMVVLMGLSVSSSLITYAAFYKCDPLHSYTVNIQEQIFPYFVGHFLSEYKGMAGLFTLGIYSTATSTFSSGLNAIGTLVVEDVIRIQTNLKETRSLFYARLIVVMFSIVIMSLAYIATVMSKVFQLIVNLLNIAGGIVVGLFSLGILFPWANGKGAIIGCLSGFAVVGWIIIGAMLSGSGLKNLPVTTNGCDKHSPKIIFKDLTDTGYIFPLYTVSYVWFGFIGCLTTYVVGIIMSLIFGPTDPRTLKPYLVYPLCYKIFFFLPNAARQRLLFRIPYKGEYGVYLEENLKETIIQVEKIESGSSKKSLPL